MADRDTLLSLAERAETLEHVDRHTLRYLFQNIAREMWGGPPLRDWDAERARRAIWHRFFTLVEAEAWLDAALLLVPERWDHGTGNHDSTGGAWAWVAEADDARGEFWQTIQNRNAATPALALTAATLRAHAAQGEG